MSLPSLDGRTIRLRDIALRDLPTYERYLQRGQRWQELDAPWEQKLDGKEVAQIIFRLRTAIMTGAMREPRVRMAIADIETDAFLGSVSWYWETEVTNWASVGIGIYDPAHWGRGAGYEALGLWCDYLLDACPSWARIGCSTWSGNLAMMRLASKLGFTLECRARNARVLGDRHYDALGYGSLREEWLARYPEGFAATLGDSNDT